MATADEERLSSQAVPYREAERLLDIAERLDKECQQQQLVIAVRSMGYFTAIAALLTLAVIIWQMLSSFLFGVSIFLLGAYATLMTVWFWQMTGQKNKLLDRDRRALSEIVHMLREVEKAVADRSHLSALERAEFRIRLSRFDVGRDYYDNTRW